MRLGAIFDWDGVIVDSAAQHERSWNLLAEEEGLVILPGHFKKGFGMKNEFFIPNVLEWTTDRAEIRRLSARKEELYREELTRTDIEPFDGVFALLELLDTLDIPCAVGSSTTRRNIQAAMERIGLEKWFAAVVSGEDVEMSKPDPAVFLLAARLLDCAPANCVVFEDAPAGIAAAHNARMRAVGVATTHPSYELTDAEIVVQRLDEIGRSHLALLFHAADQPVF